MAPPIMDAAYSVAILWDRRNEISVFTDKRWFGDDFISVKMELSSPPHQVVHGFGTVRLQAVRDCDHNNEVTSTRELSLAAFFVPDASCNLIAGRIDNATVGPLVGYDAVDCEHVFRDNANGEVVAHLIRSPHEVNRLWLDGQRRESCDFRPVEPEQRFASLEGPEKARFEDFLDLTYGMLLYTEPADLQAVPWRRQTLGTRKTLSSRFGLHSDDATGRVSCLSTLHELRDVLSIGLTPPMAYHRLPLMTTISSLWQSKQACDIAEDSKLCTSRPDTAALADQDDWTAEDRAWCERNIGSKEQFVENLHLGDGVHTAFAKILASAMIRGFRRELSETTAR